MNKVCFTLDVLSDGSEFIGATLFLSVWKRPRRLQPTNDDYTWLQETVELNAPLARYAISGLGDATARLCADQRMKLSPTRAVFVPSIECAEGLSALLLALINSGSPSLHVVSNENLDVEDLASITLGKHRHLNIHTCHVPSQRQWWKVYDDEYLTVHAQMSPNQGSIVYLISIRLQDDSSNKLHTVAVLPPQCEDYTSVIEDLKSEDLPLLDDGGRLSVDSVIVLDPKNYHPDTVSSTTNNTRIFVTLPSNLGPPTQNAIPDPGLLIHAQQVAKYFANHIPWAFPSTPCESRTLSTSTSPFERINSNPFVLHSCTSLLLDTKSLVLLDRRRDLWNRPLSDEWSITLTSLQSLIPNPNMAITDENEISLDDDSDSEEQHEEDASHISKPQLVVLGTGCASPSAIRGASGYALIIPRAHDDTKQDVFLLDCGEGVTTMLARTCQHVDWVHSIGGIWISHAHLDHYGGLPTLLRTVSNARRQENSATTRIASAPAPKRPRVVGHETNRVPWVMAPAKVLHYLDAMLDCKHGMRQTPTREEQLFVPLLHQDPTPPPGPWSWFQNIKVYHNCCPSYGLLLRLQDSWLCYSGDTRPCRSLVAACRRQVPNELLLIHEATFAQAEQEQAELKKHSTVAEALSIASQIPATRVLLTHFSQRYLSMERPAEASASNNGTPPIPMGYAMDGLRLNL